MQTWVRRFIAAALVIAATPGLPAAGQNAAIDTETIAAFVKHNLSLLADGQIYVGAPNVKSIEDWIDGQRVRRDVQRTTPGGFVDGPPGPDIILINRGPDDFAAAFEAFSHEMTSSGFDQAEVVRLWSVLLAARGVCNVAYPREYMAVISIDPAVDVTSCVRESIYWFRGPRILFNEFASMEGTNATREIDDQLASALRDCAPLGWLDLTVRDCVLGRFPVTGNGPDVTAELAPPYSRSFPKAAFSRLS